jgi:hypothetical protein
MGVNYNPTTVTDGLVLCLDAANQKSYPGTGTVWADLSGNGNNCVWNNTPAFDSAGYFTFNGTSNYGTITNNPTLDFSSFQTLSIVMRHTYTSGRRNPWDQAYAGYGTWTHEQGEGINWFFGDGGGNNTPYVSLGSATTPRDVWNVMTVVRDTTTYRWLLNGVQTSSTATHSYGVLTTTLADIRIGLGYTGYWQGDMSSVMAYTRSLSNEEIQKNFNALRGRYGI